MVFGVSVLIIVAFVLWGALDPQGLAARANEFLAFTTGKFGWFYLFAALGFLVFVIYLAFSRYGRIRLGEDTDEPEYSDWSWFAMLFSAGMGIGLVFWGVAEPLSHYASPPQEAESGSTEAARLALRYAFFHWGLHPWAIYSVVGVALAYFQFRKKKTALISQTFEPLIGDRVNGPLGKFIDILAIIATAFGVATSLGLGTLQINGGLNFIWGIPNGVTVQIVILIVLTILYLLSAASGLDKGIRILSNTNLIIAIGLLVCTFILGPTFFLLDTFTVTLGGYLQNLIQMSLRMTPFTQGTWVSSWTLFYWAWWIAWAPFVGMFIARVSRGRTIKEFVLGVLFIPSLFSFIWFSVFGGTGLHQQIMEGIPLTDLVNNDVTTALFATLSHLPLGSFLAVLAALLIVTFFVTSADSATYVLGMFSSGGSLVPSVKVKVAWGVAQAAIALVLLLSHGLEALQTASIVTALPFAVIMGGMCVSLLRSLQAEERMSRKKEREFRKAVEAVIQERKH
ncbi:glycine betaine uptake BCCT transporter [Paenibacillus mucilaginosus]|uniref:Choline/carnitine/betaine transporter n=1 Tax=Paenibacillus mucilaginosus (strain KNP414) TaxID=1036673 RepID=F8F566_PAEMK|nr:BCCT family transporter [Paenibacillus mucilaginosus]AEI40796.1 choline/carnitine/betaine transporter [Paenibacillus mucilaginosus KNP414]MCG7211729.1 BCCT family transporter [Paenibacillus mucilaginosus]WDM29915.1 BCCT family transporter [Paenibacillus mucilaginosus]